MNSALAGRLAITLTEKTPETNSKPFKTVTILQKADENGHREQFRETYYEDKKSSNVLELRAGDPPIDITGIPINNQDPLKQGLRVEVNDSPPTVRSGDEETITRIDPRECEAIYLREGMVYTWINRLTGYHLASEPRIFCANERDQKIMDSIISKSQLRKILKNLFTKEYTYGNFILKWDIKNGKKVGVDWIDPKYFDAVRDDYGRVKYGLDGRTPIGYIQYLKMNQQLPFNFPEERKYTQMRTMWDYQGGKKGILFKPEEIVHFILNKLGDSWWGVGIIEPCYNFIKVKQNADEGFGEMMQRTGFPRIIAKVGDASHPPTQEQVDDVWGKLTDLHTKHQFVVPYYYDLSILESNKPDRFRFNLEYFQSGIVSGLGGPKPFITGIGENTNRATLGDQKLWLERDLKNQQEDVTSQFESRVLNVLAKEYNFAKVPTIVWAEISTESLESKADRLTRLAKVGLLVPDEGLLNYIRDSERLPISKGPSPKENEKEIKEKAKPEEPKKNKGEANGKKE